MADKTAEDILAAAFTKIAANLDEAGAAYADLGGNVYDRKTYLERLHSDPTFAEQQLTAFLQPPAKEDGGITPTEQRNVARRVETYVKTFNDLHLDHFLKANPALVDVFSVRDLKRVLDTLKFELGLDVIVPDAVVAADDEDQPLKAIIGV